MRPAGAIISVPQLRPSRVEVPVFRVNLLEPIGSAIVRIIAIVAVEEEASLEVRGPIQEPDGARVAACGDPGQGQRQKIILPGPDMIELIVAGHGLPETLELTHRSE